MSDDMLIKHCAPTLMGLKTGNMFSFKFETDIEEHRSLTEINRRLGAKGLRAIPLRRYKGSTLIYLFRPSRLKADLNDRQAMKILGEMGYHQDSVGFCIAGLMKKLRENADFPHEIGLFLGYPPEDVCGFIKNKGGGCKCVGCWKVYGDADKARQTFDKYKRCTELCCSLAEKGYSVERMAVSDDLLIKQKPLQPKIITHSPLMISFFSE